MLIYADPTAKWVPFATATIITVMVWGATAWQELSFSLANTAAFWVAIVLLIGILLQGWLYWKGQVETLSFDGTTAEARTMRWTGWSPKLRFTPAEATGWKVMPKHGEPTKIGNIVFVVRGRELSLSMHNPKLVDLDALSRLEPSFFAKARADFPALTAVTG